MSHDTVAGVHTSGRRTRLAALWPAAVAVALGFSILYMVGFAGAESVHDAAHDTRHSMNFPCH